MPRKPPAKDSELNKEELEWRKIHDTERTLNINQIRFRIMRQKEDAAKREANARRKEELRAQKEKEKARQKALKLQQKLEKEAEKERKKAEKNRQKEEEKLAKQMEQERQRIAKERQREKTQQTKEEEKIAAERKKEEQAALQARLKQKQAEIAAEGGDPNTGLSLDQFLKKARILTDQADVDDLVTILHTRLIQTFGSLELRPQDYMAAIRLLREIKSEDEPKVEEDPYQVETMSPEDLMERTVEVIMVYLRLWQEQHSKEVRWLEPILKELFRCIFLNEPPPQHSAIAWLIQVMQPFYGQTPNPLMPPTSSD